MVYIYAFLSLLQNGSLNKNYKNFIFFSGLSHIHEYSEFLFVAMASPASGKYNDPQKHFEFLKNLLSDCKDVLIS